MEDKNSVLAVVVAVIAVAVAIGFGIMSRSPSTPDAPKVKETTVVNDAQLVKANTDLKATNLELRKQIDSLNAENSALSSDNERLQADYESLSFDNNTLQSQYDELYAVHQNSPQYELDLARERGFHFSVGAMAEIPKDDPLAIKPWLMLGVSKQKWQVLVGGSYDYKTNGLKGSVGVMYRFH